MENRNWKVSYIDANREEIHDLVIRDKTEEEANEIAGNQMPLDRAIDDFTVNPL